jgi:hypothetical protein
MSIFPLIVPLFVWGLFAILLPFAIIDSLAQSRKKQKEAHLKAFGHSIPVGSLAMFAAPPSRGGQVQQRKAPQSRP